MSHFSTALSEIIERSFDGNASNFTRKTAVSSSTTSRLLTGKFEPRLDNLDEIAKHLSRSDRKQLLIAAARDRVPAAYQDEIFGDEDPASQLLRAKLSPDLAAVIRYLESTAMTDESTASYLRKIGEWIGISQPAAKPEPLRSVAEDATAYKTNGKSA